MSKYQRKVEVVDVRVITPEGFEQLRAEAPGIVKRASVGDYVVGSTPENVRIVTPEELARDYEPVVEGGLTLQQLAGDVDALRSRVSELERGTEAIGKRTADMDNLLHALTTPAAPPPETKPQTGKPK